LLDLGREVEPSRFEIPCAELYTPRSDIGASPAVSAQLDGLSESGAAFGSTYSDTLTRTAELLDFGFDLGIEWPGSLVSLTFQCADFESSGSK
jgi:hypothetical protein